MDFKDNSVEQDLETTKQDDSPEEAPVLDPKLITRDIFQKIITDSNKVP